MEKNVRRYKGTPLILFGWNAIKDKRNLGMIYLTIAFQPITNIK